MLNVLTIRPPIADLYKVIDKVSKYPVTDREIVDIAARIKAPKEVVDFYRTFKNKRVFNSRDELAEISEQIDLMRQEEAGLPREIERGPEEY